MATDARKIAAAVGESARAEWLARDAPDSWIDPGERGEHLAVFDSPTYAIGRLNGIIRRSFMPDYVEPFGLSIPEWRVLAAVAERASLSFNEICSAITMDRAQVSRTLGTLLTKGFVVQLTTARGGRLGRGQARTETKLVLTPAGRKAYDGILPIAREHQLVLLSALSEQERALLHQALRKMIAAAEAFEAGKTVQIQPPDDARRKRADVPSRPKRRTPPKAG